MVGREELNKRWDDIKRYLQQNWRGISDSELAQFSGNPNQLIRAIQQKTGASWNEVESFLSGLIKNGRTASHQLGGLAEHYGEDVKQFAREGYDQFAAETAKYAKKVAQGVRQRPMESIAIAFGIGLFAGAVLLMKKRQD